MFTHFLGGKDYDVAAHFARITSSDATLYQDLEVLIMGLKADGLWDKIEVLCVVHDTEADSLLNLRGTDIGPDSTKGGSPSFTANRGFICTTTGSINLNLTETTTTIFGQYDGHIMDYIRSKPVNGFYNMNCTYPLINRTSGFVDVTGNWGWLIQGKGTNQVSTAAGCLIASINAIDDRLFRVNDTTDSEATSTAHSLIATAAFSVSGNNVAGQHNSAWGLGGGLTAAEMALYENRLRTYMQARGADVY